MNPEFRRRAFRAAIAAAGIESVAAWAALRGKNANQVYMVLNQNRSDPRVLMMIDTFIVETLMPFTRELRDILDIRAERRSKVAEQQPAEHPEAA